MRHVALTGHDDVRLSVVHPEDGYQYPNRPVYAAVKRASDIVLALMLLVLTSPFWLAAAVAVRLSSPGPIIFRQVRCGERGRPFVCYKFRTMVDGADRQKEALLPLNQMTGPAFKLRNDPRVTPVGRWLRKTSVDELPQLLNVIRGEMSLVGPRPPLPGEVAQYGPHERRRLYVKPGLTCLWQVSGRSDIGFDEWVNLDLRYIECRSFWFDVKLLILTVPAVITGRGAA